jgi:ATP-binding cassette subfamily B protein
MRAQRAAASTSARDADLIVVMNRGRIVERGTHDQLIAGHGLYSWLWRSQARRDARQIAAAGLS